MARHPKKELARLLQSTFTADQLRSFVASLDGGQEVLDQLPEDASPAKLVSAVTDELGRQGLVDSSFFDALRETRPRRVKEIDDVAALFDRPTTKAEPPPESPPHEAATFTAGFRVPFDRRPLFGREPALDELHRRFSGGERTIVITGMGGLGKTQLAVEYAFRHRDDYPGGVVWLTGDQPLDGQLDRLSTDAEWTHPKASSETRVIEARLRLPKLERALIIVDNVVDLAPIDAIVPPSSRSVRLMTSIPGLPLPPLPIGLLKPEEALELFRVESGRHADDDARALVERLDGWPLAIELAAAYLRYTDGVSNKDYVKLLESRGVDSPLLQDASVVGTSRTRHTPDLRATLRASAPALAQNPVLAEVLDVLAWSGRSAMGRPLLAALMGRSEEELIPALGTGVRLQFLRLEGEGRYRIHRFLQDVVREDSGTTAEVLHERVRRGIEWFVGRRSAFRDLASFEAELAHLEAWGAMAKERGWAREEAAALWLGAYPSYHRGEVRNACLRLTQAEECALSLPQGETRLLARILADLTSVLNVVGPVEAVRRRAIQLADSSVLASLGTRDRVGALVALSEFYRQHSPLGTVLAERAVAESAALPPSDTCWAPAQYCLATRLGELGRRQEAITLAERCVQAVRSTSDIGEYGLAKSLGTLALLLATAEGGAPLRAVILAEEAYRVHAACNPHDTLTLSEFERIAGIAEHRLAGRGGPGRLAHARRAFEHVSAAAATRRNQLGTAAAHYTDTLIQLALITWDLGYLENNGTKQVQAIKHLDEILTLAEPDSPEWREASTLRDDLASRGIPGFKIPKRPRR